MNLRNTIAAVAAAGGLAGSGLVLFAVGESEPSPVPLACAGGLCQATRTVINPAMCPGLLQMADGNDRSIRAGDPDPCGPSAIIPAGLEAVRQLECLRRADLLIGWVAYPAEGGDDPGATGCLYDALMTLEQAQAWGEAVDRGLSTAPPTSRLADLPAAAKINGVRRHTWFGVEVDP